MCFTKGYSLNRLSRLLCFLFSKALIKKKKILTAVCKYPQVFSCSSIASRALQRSGGRRAPAERSRCRSAPSTGTWRKSPAYLCLPLPPWEPLRVIFAGLDQPETLLSCWGEMRYLARGITLLPSSPTQLSRHLRPSSRLAAEIVFQPFRSWD